jgi:hypothetical protein
MTVALKAFKLLAFVAAVLVATVILVESLVVVWLVEVLVAALILIVIIVQGLLLVIWLEWHRLGHLRLRLSLELLVSGLGRLVELLRGIGSTECVVIVLHRHLGSKALRLRLVRDECSCLLSTWGESASVHVKLFWLWHRSEGTGRRGESSSVGVQRGAWGSGFEWCGIGFKLSCVSFKHGAINKRLDLKESFRS